MTKMLIKNFFELYHSKKWNEIRRLASSLDHISHTDFKTVIIDFMGEKWLDYLMSKEHFSSEDRYIFERDLRGYYDAERVLSSKGFLNINLSCCNFDSIMLYESTLSKCDLSFSTIVNSLFIDNFILHADLSQSHLKKTSIERCLFYRCNLIELRVEEVFLSDIKLQNCYILDTDLSSLDLNDVQFDSSVYDECTVWPKGFCINNKGLIGPGCSNDRKIFRDIDIPCLDLEESLFQGCMFVNCRFIECDLSKCTFNNCKFISVEFNSSDLRGVSFLNSEFEEVSTYDCHLDRGTRELLIHSMTLL